MCSKSIGADGGDPRWRWTGEVIGVMAGRRSEIDPRGCRIGRSESPSKSSKSDLQVGGEVRSGESVGDDGRQSRYQDLRALDAS